MPRAALACALAPLAAAQGPGEGLFSGFGDELPRPHQGYLAGRSLAVAIAQFTSTPDVDTNVGAIVNYTAAAAQRGARVVVFPEMSVTGYYTTVIRNVTQAQLTAAEGVIAAACRTSGIYCIVGIPHFYAEQKWYNTALVIDDSGRKVYRQAKVYPCCPQDGTAGEWLGTFDIDGVTCAVEICFDTNHMEIAKLQMLKGAKVLFHLSWEYDMSWEYSVPSARALSQARAQETQMFVVYANAGQTLRPNPDGAAPGGPNPFQGSHGQSRFVDPYGIVLREAPLWGDALLVQALDLSLPPAAPAWGNDTLGHPLLGAWWRDGVRLMRDMPVDLPATHAPLPGSAAPSDAEGCRWRGATGAAGAGGTLRVAAAQLITDEGVAANVQKIVSYAGRAAAAGARVVVFPEMAVTGYDPAVIAGTPQPALTRAEDDIAAACRAGGIYCIFGIPQRFGASDWHNTAVVVDPSGEKIYRQAKVYPCCAQDDRRPDRLAAGHWLGTFDVDGFRASLQICFDEFHPEVSRLPLLNGTQILFFLHWESAPQEEYKQQTYRAMIQARAYDLGVPVVHSNAGWRTHANGSAVGSHGQSGAFEAGTGRVLAEAPIFGEHLVVLDVPVGPAPPPPDTPLLHKWWDDARRLLARMPV